MVDASRPGGGRCYGPGAAEPNHHHEGLDAGTLTGPRGSAGAASRFKGEWEKSHEEAALRRVHGRKPFRRRGASGPSQPVIVQPAPGIVQQPLIRASFPAVRTCPTLESTSRTGITCAPRSNGTTPMPVALRVTFLPQGKAVSGSGAAAGPDQPPPGPCDALQGAGTIDLAQRVRPSFRVQPSAIGTWGGRVRARGSLGYHPGDARRHPTPQPPHHRPGRRPPAC
jgi:hypothetical protein